MEATLSASAAEPVPEPATGGGIVHFCELFPMLYKLFLNLIEPKPEHLTRSQLLILLLLMRKQTLTMSQVAEQLASSKEQTTRAVAPLVEQGYVQRLEDSHNRKLVLVQMTDAGWELMRQQRQLILKNLTERYEKLPEADMDALGAAIDTIIGILTKMDPHA